MQTTVLPKQERIDMTVQSTADVERWFEVVQGLSSGLTDRLAVGSEVMLPEAAGPKKRLAERLQRWNNRPASAYEGLDALPGGIGYMQVGSDFRVR